MSYKSSFRQRLDFPSILVNDNSYMERSSEYVFTSLDQEECEIIRMFDGPFELFYVHYQILQIRPRTLRRKHF